MPPAIWSGWNIAYTMSSFPSANSVNPLEHGASDDLLLVLGSDFSTSSPRVDTAPPTPAIDEWSFLEMNGLQDVHTLAWERLGFLGDAVAGVEIALGNDEDLGGEYAELRVLLAAESRERFRELHSRAMDALLAAFDGRDLSHLVIALLRSA
jgi:hypothetical protein